MIPRMRLTNLESKEVIRYTSIGKGSGYHWGRASVHRPLLLSLSSSWPRLNDAVYILLGFWDLIKLLPSVVLLWFDHADAQGFDGNPACPCLVQNLTLQFPVNPDDIANADALRKIGSVLVSSDEYGRGCAAHDQHTPQCTNNTACSGLENVLPPRPINCDLSWCNRSWCFVDPNQCHLLNRKSPIFTRSNRYYSYATCGDADAFTQNTRLAALQGSTLKVGLNSNSGGWVGAYSSTGEQFRGPAERWSGPLVGFVQEASLQGGFVMNITTPPDFLKPRSDAYAGSISSPFDLCVYATSLGYLDLCVAQYTITDVRAGMTDWLLLESQGVYLIGQLRNTGAGGAWDDFIKSSAIIFQPFTFNTWIFIIFFVIPVLGCLMIVHEFGTAGTTYPRNEKVVIVNQDGSSAVKKIPVPFIKHVVKSVYVALLGVLQQSYEQTVTSIGAMLNLLGISFFILTIIAAYTANLAALLTKKVQLTSVQSIEGAVQRGYRFCAERKNMETVTRLYPYLKPVQFVVDPLEIGGDGLPGFNCPNCSARVRVFDYLDVDLASAGDWRYCQVAIAPQEDLTVRQALGMHCNKTAIGSPVQNVQTGIPIFEGVSPQLSSFLLKLKNDGILDDEINSARPSSQCPVVDGGAGDALSISQLSGIWVVSFGFAFVGLIVTFMHSLLRRKVTHREFRVKPLHKRDQRGSRVDALSDDDSDADVVLEEQQGRQLRAQSNFFSSSFKQCSVSWPPHYSEMLSQTALQSHQMLPPARNVDHRENKNGMADDVNFDLSMDERNECTDEDIRANQGVNTSVAITGAPAVADTLLPGSLPLPPFAYALDSVRRRHRRASSAGQCTSHNNPIRAVNMDHLSSK